MTKTLEQTTKILKKYGLDANKSLGQNFLIADNVLSAISQVVSVNHHDGFLEIGPGIGTLTKRLESIGKVRAIEVDERFANILLNRFKGKDVEVKIKDALEVNLKDELEELGGSTPAVISNLPYYITSPLILKYINEASESADGYFMVQKEVADRICAEPRKKDYGALSVRVQIFCRASRILEVPKESFYPVPKVDSTFIHLTRKTVLMPNAERVASFAEACFQMKRKTLANNIASFTGKKKADVISKLLGAGFSATVRAEECSLDDFEKLRALFGERSC